MQLTCEQRDAEGFPREGRLPRAAPAETRELSPEAGTRGSPRARARLEEPAPGRREVLHVVTLQIRLSLFFFFSFRTV